MKNSSMPSLAALLGLLAVAGYQNRGKIGDLLKQATGSGGDTTGTGASGGLLGGVMKNVTDALGGGDGAGVKGGIADIVDSFRGAGQGSAADSWIAKGPNQPVTPAETETALGGDLVDMLVKQTGLNREDILDRLAKVLPEAVDKMTPDGRLPA